MKSQHENSFVQNWESMFSTHTSKKNQPEQDGILYVSHKTGVNVQEHSDLEVESTVI